MYKKIMVPLDGSALAECVLPHVEAITKGCAAKELILLRIVEPERVYTVSSSPLDPNIASARDSEQRKFAEDYLKQMRAQFSRVVMRKPKASRPRSKEIYGLATGFKG